MTIGSNIPVTIGTTSEITGATTPVTTGFKIPVTIGTTSETTGPITGRLGKTIGGRPVGSGRLGSMLVSGKLGNMLVNGKLGNKLVSGRLGRTIGGSDGVGSGRLGTEMIGSVGSVGSGGRLDIEIEIDIETPAVDMLGTDIDGVEKDKVGIGPGRSVIERPGVDREVGDGVGVSRGSPEDEGEETVRDGVDRVGSDTLDWNVLGTVDDKSVGSRLDEDRLGVESEVVGNERLVRLEVRLSELELIERVGGCKRMLFVTVTVMVTVGKLVGQAG